MSRSPRWAQELAATFPSAWRRTTVGALGQLVSGSTPPRVQHERYFNGGTIPWVKTGDLTDGDVFQTEELITEHAVRECRCTVHPPGTVLVAMYGGFQQIGRTGILRVAAATNQAITAVRIEPTSKLTSEYLQTWLNHKKYVWRRIAGSSRKDPNISKTAISSFPLPVPDEDLLSRLDLSMRQADRLQRCFVKLIAAKREFKRALMQRLLTGKQRFPQFKDQPWVKTTIGSVLEEVSRPVKWDESSDYTLVSVRRRSGGIFLREKKKGEEIKVKAQFEIRQRDILISTRQVVHGAVAIVSKEFDGAHVSGEYMLLVPKLGAEILPEYFDHLSRTPWMYHVAYLASYGVDIEKMTFNPEWYLASMVNLPPTKEEQQRIVDTLSTADREIALLIAQLECFSQYKRGIAFSLLSGADAMNV